jgi:DNA repair exonuclease SbcCD ATPase subunit
MPLVAMLPLMPRPVPTDSTAYTIALPIHMFAAREFPPLTFMLQALLARHENYVSEAEKDRRRMMDKITSLEQQNLELEGSNKRTIQENRDLLDQLEALNGAVKDSQAKVQSLTEVLNSTEYELERMAGLTARAEKLHMQLAQLEDDLATANSVVAVTRDDHRAATLRWQHAERTITSLQAEMERIEFEAKSERERHAEVCFLFVVTQSTILS